MKAAGPDIPTLLVLNLVTFGDPGAASAPPAQVELSTERSHLALLYDSTGAPLPALQPGQRHCFAMKHDIKDLVRRCGRSPLVYTSSWCASVVVVALS